MRRIDVERLDDDLTPVAGLAVVGHDLNARGPAWRRLDAALPVRTGVGSSDIVRASLGLLVQGKSDFDAVDGFRGDAFFKHALGVRLLASGPTLRQRLDAKASAMFEHVAPMIQTLLTGQRPDYGVLPCGWLPLDVHAFATDNGGIAKEGVSRTCAVMDGDDCPLAASLGEHGFWLELALCPGKRVALWEDELRLPGIERPLRRVLRFVERTVDRRGQPLIVPEVEPEGWRTSLSGQFSAQDIVALYAGHGTHERFHAEFNSALDLQRLPSGKFDTNHLVCQLAALAMNILRLMGQRALLGPDAPLRHPAKRQRIRTVMQELICRAARIVEHARRFALGLGGNDRAAAVFARLHEEHRSTVSVAP